MPLRSVSFIIASSRRKLYTSGSSWFSNKTLKLLNRQYNQSVKIQTMIKNNLISLTDSVFPGVNKLFTSPERQSDGHEKWVDFLKAFPHKDCAAKLYLSSFKAKYKSWCSKNKYNYTDSKAEEIHAYARSVIAVLPLNDSVKLLVTQAVTSLTPYTKPFLPFARRWTELLLRCPNTKP